MPGPYRAAMGKRDVSAGWRAAYMRPLQTTGRFMAMIVGGGVLDAPRRGQDFPYARIFKWGVGRPALWPPWPFAAAGSVREG